MGMGDDPKWAVGYQLDDAILVRPRRPHVATVSPDVAEYGVEGIIFERRTAAPAFQPFQPSSYPTAPQSLGTWHGEAVGKLC